MSYPILAYKNLLQEAQAVGSLANQFEKITSPPLHIGMYSAETSETVEINFPAPVKVDCLAIGRNNLREVRLDEYKNSSWLEVATLSCEKNCQLNTFTAVTNQKFRFIFTGADSLFIAHLFLGPKLSFEIGVSQGFVPPRYALENRAYTSKMANNWLGKSHWGKGVNFQVHFQFLTLSFYKTQLAPFVEHAVSLPFFFSYDNQNHADQCVYGFLDDRRGIPQPKIELPGWVNFGWNMQGIYE